MRRECLWVKSLSVKVIRKVYEWWNREVESAIPDQRKLYHLGLQNKRQFKTAGHGFNSLQGRLPLLWSLLLHFFMWKLFSVIPCTFTVHEIHHCPLSMRITFVFLSSNLLALHAVSIPFSCLVKSNQYCLLLCSLPPQTCRFFSHLTPLACVFS